jgi:capsular polysaccharide biosynthesis protein
MIRYVETLFRYWLIVLIPIIALPIVGYLQVRHLPHRYYAFTNIFVVTSPTDPALPSFETPAQNEQGIISQWLQSPKFCLSVAKGSALYARILAQAADPLQVAGSDLGSNVQVNPKGNNLLTIGYTAADPVRAMQVLQSLLTTTSSEVQTMKIRNADETISYYRYQLFQAQQQQRDSAGKLADYERLHGVDAANLGALLAADPTLASLYQQNKNDHDAVANLQEQVKAIQVGVTVPPGVVNQDGYIQMDLPSYVGVSNRKTILLDLGITVVLGLLLACAFIVAMTALDRSIRRPEEVPQMLALPVLAVVPHGALLARRPQPTSSAGQQRLAGNVKGATVR